MKKWLTAAALTLIGALAMSLLLPCGDALAEIAYGYSSGGFACLQSYKSGGSNATLTGSSIAVVGHTDANAHTTGTAHASLTIPASVTVNGSAYSVYAVGVTGYTSAYGGYNAKSLAYVNGLTTVTLESGIRVIGQSAFAGAKSLKTVNIASTVTTIGQAAFNNCPALTTVNMPTSVTSIGANAFDSSNLTVRYAGTSAQWANVSIGSGNNLSGRVVCLGDQTTPKPTTPPTTLPPLYEKYAGDYTVKGTNGSLAINNGPGTSYTKLGSIPEGTTIHITKATGYNGRGSSSGNWGYTTYGGVSGYCAMNYLERVALSAWISASRTSVNVGESVSFSFGANRSADFWLHVQQNGVDVDVPKANNGMTTSGTTSYTFNTAGTYTVYIGATDYSSEIGSSAVTIVVRSPVNLGDNFYAFIRNQSQGVYFTNQLDNIAGEVYTGDAKQLWRFVRQSNGSYAILSAVNNACVDVQGVSVEGGTNVYAYNGGQTAFNANQQFYIYSQYGAYYFSPVHTNGLCMLDMNATSHNLEIWAPGEDWAPQEFDIITVPTFNGTLPVNLGDNFYAFIRHQAQNVYLTNQLDNIAGAAYTCDANQIWRFVRQNNGSYAILSAVNNACMDVLGVATDDGTNVYAYNGGQTAFNANQQFYIYNTYGAYYFSPVHAHGQKMVDMNATSLNAEIWGPGADWSPQEFDIVMAKYPIPNKPTLTVSASDSLHASILTWGATNNTDFYSIRIYDASGTLVHHRDDYGKTAFAALLPAGTYEAEVASVKRDTWVTESDRVAFTVAAASPSHAPEPVRSGCAGDKLYKLFSCDGTWLEDKALAEASGGRLAIIDSQAKQDCVFEMVHDFNQFVYLGAQGYSNYKWLWVDGSVVEGFTFWDENKPDNWQGLENCLMMYPSNGSWEDYPCADISVHGYVAEYDAVRLAVEPIKARWLAGVDRIRENLAVTVTYADGSSVPWAGDYALTTSAGDGTLTATVTCAGLTASCTVSTTPPEPDFILPESLTVIEASAFAGTDMRVARCPEGLEEIGALAFANCERLTDIYIPGRTVAIAPTAFQGCDGLTIWGKPGSAAQAFAEAHGFDFMDSEE